MDYYIMDIFKYSDVKKVLGQQREVLLKARLLCIIRNNDYYSKELLRKIDNTACGIFSHITFDEGCVGGMEKYLLKLEELCKFAVDILPHTLTVGMPDGQEKPYQYVYKVGDKTKVVAQSMPAFMRAERDWNSFTPYKVKQSESLSRTRRKIYELAMCNEWKYYVTFTISKEKFERTDLDGYMQKFTKWLNNYSRKLDGNSIQYLLVVEQGRKGSYHLHGLMNGIPPDHLSPFERGKHPRELVEKGYLNWEAYYKKFGFCSFGEIISKKGVAKYLTKKIRTTSKTIEHGRHKRLYYCSKGLKRPTEIVRGTNLIPNDFDFENDYTGITWYE